MTYETYGADGKVHIHVASSMDFGASMASDIEEYSFAPLPLAQVNPNNPGANREFGDYDFLMSIGDMVYGTFAGLGDVNTGAIDTTGLIDPFFFSATDIPEPASWSLIRMGLVGTAWLRRRPPVKERWPGVSARASSLSTAYSASMPSRLAPSRSIR
jgi:hypothetical protein